LLQSSAFAGGEKTKMNKQNVEIRSLAIPVTASKGVTRSNYNPTINVGWIAPKQDG
jgi:hypothetical protein